MVLGSCSCAVSLVAVALQREILLWKYIMFGFSHMLNQASPSEASPSQASPSQTQPRAKQRQSEKLRFAAQALNLRFKVQGLWLRFKVSDAQALGLEV